MYFGFLFHFISCFFTRKYYSVNDTSTLLEKIGTNSAFEQECKYNLTTQLKLNNNTMIPNRLYIDGMDNQQDSI